MKKSGKGKTPAPNKTKKSKTEEGVTLEERKKKWAYVDKKEPPEEEIDRRTQFPRMEYCKSLHDITIGGKPMFPVPHQQREDYCHFHACIYCHEARTRQKFGEEIDIPQLSVQHCINSLPPVVSEKLPIDAIQPKEPSRVIPWLKETGVTTENDIHYFGLVDNQKFVKEVMRLYKLKDCIEKPTIHMVPGEKESKARIEEIKGKIDKNEPVIATVVMSGSYDYHGGVRSYFREGINTGFDMIQTHSVVIVGYCKRKKDNFESWVYLNSWGKDFGYCGGFGFMDFYVIRRVYYLIPLDRVEEVGLLQEEQPKETKVEQGKETKKEKGKGKVISTDCMEVQSKCCAEMATRCDDGEHQAVAEEP